MVRAVAWRAGGTALAAELGPSSKYDVILRHKLHAAIFHANSLPFPGDPRSAVLRSTSQDSWPLPWGCA